MSKAQVAVEYMVVVGFVSLVIIFLVVASNLYQRDVTDQVAINQVDHLARELVDAAESVYFLGEPSKTTIKANIPARVTDIIISDREVVFSVRTGSGVTEIAYTSAVNMTGSISPHEGKHEISLETECSGILGCYVNITD